jgi:glyoxylase-like metal-dependent hydrolase (beta-lactamase superfamily II)
VVNVNWVSNKVGYLGLRVVTGVVRVDEEAPDVLIIDSGFDADVGKRILRLLGEDGLRPWGVFITHSHADHRGGANIIREKAKVKTYVGEAEACFCAEPELFASQLYGAHPPKSLRTKTIMGEGATVIDESVSSQSQLGIKGLELVDLRGHTPGQLGVKIDNYVFSGDACVSKENLEKYGFNVFFSFSHFVEALDRLVQLDVQGYVFSHGGLFSKNQGLTHIESNRAVAQEIYSVVKDGLGAIPLSSCVQEAAKRLMRFKDSLQEYLFLKTAVLSCVAHLEEKGLVRLKVVDSQLIVEHI